MNARAGTSIDVGREPGGSVTVAKLPGPIAREELRRSRVGPARPRNRQSFAAVPQSRRPALKSGIGLLNGPGRRKAERHRARMARNRLRMAVGAFSARTRAKGGSERFAKKFAGFDEQGLEG